MLGLGMFKGSENYSFEMDESCTRQVYQSCTLYISFPRAGMHNFPFNANFHTVGTPSAFSPAPGTRSRRRKWIVRTEQGAKRCDSVRGGFEELILCGEMKSGSARLVSAAFIETIPAPLRPRATSDPSGLGVPLAASLHVCAAYPPLCAHIMISLMRIKSPAWMANKLEARFSFTHQS